MAESRSATKRMRRLGRELGARTTGEYGMAKNNSRESTVKRNRDVPTGGYTLLELAVTLSLSVILTALCGQLLFSSWFGVRMLDKRADDLVMWQDVSRVLAQDFHASTSATSMTSTNSTLVVNLVDGTQYKYLVNTSGQMVRIRTGGGTAVIALNVTSFRATLNGNVLDLTVAFRSGFSGNIKLTGCQVMVS